MLFLFLPDTFSHPSFRICSNKEIQESYFLTFSRLSFWSSSKPSVFMLYMHPFIYWLNYLLVPPPYSMDKSGL